VDTLTRDYRLQTIKVRSATLRDLQRLWPALRFEDLDQTFPTFMAGVSPLVQRDRARIAGLASSYLKAHRLNAGVRGPLDVRLATHAPAEQLLTSVHATSVGAVKVGVRAGYTQSRAMDSAFVQVAGAVGRLVLNAGRETITQTTVADPRTVGWQRVGNPSAKCDLCPMLIARGAVYSEATADFEAHDSCACTAEPVYA
jgi:hypothetical protein